LLKYSFNKVAVPFNASRRFLGRTAEYAGNLVVDEGTVLGDNVVTPLNAFRQRAVAAATPETRQYVRVTCTTNSTVLSGFYEDYKLGEIDRLSDAKAEEMRKEQAAKQ